MWSSTDLLSYDCDVGESSGERCHDAPLGSAVCLRLRIIVPLQDKTDTHTITHVTIVKPSKPSQVSERYLVHNAELSALQDVSDDGASAIGHSHRGGQQADH